MAETQQTVAPSREMAKPLHIQQLENALDVRPFLAYVEHIINTPITDESSSDSDFESRLNEDELVKGSRIINGIKISKDGVTLVLDWLAEDGEIRARIPVRSTEERRSDRMRLFNLDSVKEDRYWLRDLLLSDSSDSSEDEDGPVTEEEIHSMLRLHLRRKRFAEQYHHNPENYQYQYYSVGLLSNYDKFPDHQRSIIGNKKKKKDKKAEKKLKKMKKLSAKERRMMEENQDQDMDDFDFEEGLMNLKEEDETDGYLDISQNFGKSFKSKKKAQQAKNPEIMAMRRKKIWVMMSKKELGKVLCRTKEQNGITHIGDQGGPQEEGKNGYDNDVQRAKTNNHKEMLTSCKRVAQYCMKHWRQKAMQSEEEVLSRGLSFYTTKRPDHFEMTKDVLNFARNMRLRHLFSNISSTDKPTTLNISVIDKPTTLNISVIDKPTTSNISTANIPTTSNISAADIPTTSNISAADIPTTSNISTIDKPTKSTTSNQLLSKFLPPSN
uniref:Uncharacterized protein n=1 Tax=Timema tahoe TaxID=61484 RepID=A0A7R9NXH9_9NEOP|nr:unnamed protein product [Timema tahoe]